MLYLNPPYYVIEGVSLFPDDRDPLQFYYLPLRPHFTMITGPDGAGLVPSLMLIEYKGDAGNGGFLIFDVDLSLPAGLLDTVADELRQQAKLTATPHLAPVPVIDGNVRLLLFGQESPSPPDPKNPAASPKPSAATASDPSAPPKFVIKIQGAAKPALYGDENASFSVQLDAQGVTLMKAAMQQGIISPIGVVYQLDFLGLRPAFSVKLNVDWHRVQTYLDDRFSASVLFASTEVDNEIDKLIESRVIQIDVDTFVPEGEDTSVIADRDKAVNEVREMIKSTFFESSVAPPTDGTADTIDKATHIANAVSQLAVTGGWSSMASLSKRTVDITRIDQKSLKMNINERDTVRRTIYPQGHMAGMLGLARQQGVSLDAFIVQANLNDPFFQRRNVNVVSRADFDSELLAAVSVNLRYGDDIKSVELKSSKDSGAVSWPSILKNGVMQREVQYSYNCVFRNVDRAQRPTELLSDSLTTVNDTLELQPAAELYAYSVVPIVALGQFWNEYPQVQVDVKYDDDENQIHLANTFLVTADQPSVVWQMFLRDLTKRSFSYRLIFRAANNQDITGSWIETDQESIIVRDPLPNKRTLYITPAIDWTLVDRVEVDVSYTETDGTISAEAHYEFSAADQVTKVFSTPLKDPAHRQVGYQVTIIKKRGVVVQVPVSLTTQPRLIILTEMRGHRVVMVAPADVEFPSKKIRQIDVEMRYTDDSDHLGVSDSFTFKTIAGRAQFEYDYVDDQKIGYQYRTTTTYTSGLSKSIDWTDASDDRLVIPVGN